MKLSQIYTSKVSFLATAVAALLFSAASVHSSDPLPDELKDVGISENLGKNVSIKELTFTNEKGEQVQLAQYFTSKKPVILNLVYYECPSLCNFVLNGFLDGLKPLEWTPGNQFEIVTVSINPKETATLATEKKAAYMTEYNRPGAENGWHFLTGQEAQIRKLADEVGFKYKWIEKDKQYSHSAALFVLTPEGKISRYLYGVLFKDRDLKLALLEASNGKIGTIVDRFLLFCYRYDPQLRKYSVYLTQLMQIAAVLTVLALGGMLALFWRRDPQYTGGGDNKDNSGGRVVEGRLGRPTRNKESNLHV